MPAGGKGFFDRTWADTFDETRDVATRYSPINLPYGKHVIEIQGRGGRGSTDRSGPDGPNRGPGGRGPPS